MSLISAGSISLDSTLNTQIPNPLIAKSDNFANGKLCEIFLLWQQHCYRNDYPVEGCHIFSVYNLKVKIKTLKSILIFPNRD